MTFQAELFSSQIGQLIIRQRNKTCVNVATCLGAILGIPVEAIDPGTITT